MDEAASLLVRGAEDTEVATSDRRTWLLCVLTASVCLCGSLFALHPIAWSVPRSAMVAEPPGFPSPVALDTIDSDADGIQLRAVTNTEGYEPLTDHTMQLYARWSHIVEPHRTTCLSARRTSTKLSPVPNASHLAYSWRVSLLTDNGGTEVVIFEASGENVRVKFTRPTAYYRISLAELEVAPSPNGGHTHRVRRTYETSSVMCKYVRRELRNMTDADRTLYLDALEIVYNTSMADGIAIYGKRFKDHAYFTALHNSKKFCYHKNLAFLTSHPAFTLQLEHALQVCLCQRNTGQQDSTNCEPCCKP